MSHLLKFRDLQELVKKYLSLGEYNGLVGAIRFPVASQKSPEEAGIDSDALGRLSHRSAACLK